MQAQKKDEDITYVVEIRLDEAEVRTLRSQLKSQPLYKNSASEVLVNTILSVCIPYNSEM